MIADREFRNDLFYRLNVFPLQVPALRQRPEDIALLVRYFAQKYSRRMNKQIESVPAEAMAALTSYSWPGNIRELENLVERAIILSRGPVLEVPLGELRQATDAEGGTLQTLEAADREHILRALRESKWVLAGPAGAAARLGMKRTTLQSRIRKLGIQRPVQN
jgi:formate hydrogenlyase transcriptional activator